MDATAKSGDNRASLRGREHARSVFFGDRQINSERKRLRGGDSLVSIGRGRRDWFSHTNEGGSLRSYVNRVRKKKAQTGRNKEARERRGHHHRRGRESRKPAERHGDVSTTAKEGGLQNLCSQKDEDRENTRTAS